MRWRDVLQMRVRSLFRRDAVDRELDAELQFHFDQQIEENLAAGMTPEAARYAAMKKIGGVTQITEACRETRGLRWLDDLAADLRYALRVLVGNPRFTIVAVLTFALGIGATTAVFTVVKGVLLAPLAFQDPNRLVSLNTRFLDEGRNVNRVTGGDLGDLLNGTNVFDEVGYYYGGEIGVQVDGRGTFAGIQLVNPGFLRVFGARADRGRLLISDDAERAAVISRGFAERTFGGSSAAIGRSITVEEHPFTIVGVTQADFHFPARADIWLAGPTRVENTSRTAYNYRAVGKLKGGTSIAAANAALDALGSRLARAYPDSNRDKRFVAVPLQEQVVGSVRPTLMLLAGAVALLLIVACVNVANLLLARAASRRHEIATRAALGAGRGRILRQVLAESVLLAVAGGASGLLVAWTGTSALLAFAPVDLPQADRIGVDASVLLFTAAISILCGIAFGLAPAVQMLRPNTGRLLAARGSRGIVGAGSHRLAHLLVIVEISLSFALAIAAGLLVRSSIALDSAELGYDPERVLVMYAHVPAKGLGEFVEAARFVEKLSPAIRTLPGVTRVAAAMGLPTGDYGSNGGFDVEGRPAAPPGRMPQANFTLASEGYFRTVGIPVRRGRDFSAADRYDAPFVAVVSDSLARSQFPDGGAIGRRIRCGLDASDEWMTIVGVVGDVRQESPASVPAPTIYMPLQQHPFHANEMQVVVRTAVEPASLAQEIDKRTHELHPAVATRFTTLDSMVAESIAIPRFRTFIVTLFACLALVLAMSGIYGVVACITAERLPDFGLRVALGATAAHVFRFVLAGALRIAAIGVTAGFLLSLAAGRFLSTLLFGLQPLDAATYAWGFAVILAVVAVAVAAPAWRASRVDPAVVLREG